MATVKVTLASLIDDGELDGYRAAGVNRIDADVCADAACAHCGHRGLGCVGYRRVGSYRAFAECGACGHCEEF